MSTQILSYVIEKQKIQKILTANPMFLTNFDSAILAKGRSAPQHSTYLVIFDEGRFRVT